MKDILIFHTIALATAIILDLLIGDPHAMPHPIRAIGALISALDKRLRRDQGPLLWLIVIFATAIVTAALMITSYRLNRFVGLAVETVLTFYILAAGSLCRETMQVYKALPDLEAARLKLSMIVGRDTAGLDEEGIVRAAVETVAENASDGVIAPLVYTALAGPVLGMIYKAVNTMDSMIGYRNERYERFGRFAAKADDVANFIPSRLSALFMIAASLVLKLFCGEPYDHARAYSIWRRDRRNHTSPNSAQTESVCAGALGVRLGGANHYGGVLVKKPYIGDDIRPIEADDIKRAIRLMFATEAVCTAVILLMMLILIFR